MITAGGPLPDSPDQEAEVAKARGQCARALVRVPGLLGEACQGLGVANTRLLYAAVARRVPAVLLGAVVAGFRDAVAPSGGSEKSRSIRWLELELLGVLLTATFSGLEPAGGRAVNVAELGRRIKVGDSVWYERQVEGGGVAYEPMTVVSAYQGQWSREHTANEYDYRYYDFLLLLLSRQCLLLAYMRSK